MVSNMIYTGHNNRDNTDQAHISKLFLDKFITNLHLLKRWAFDCRPKKTKVGFLANFASWNDNDVISYI